MKVKETFGLLGRHLGHSHSPAIHKQLGSSPYALWEIEPEALEGFLADTSKRGFNVTIPYKEMVLPYLISIEGVAKEIGAVNTIVRKDDGWHGYNTDYGGFAAACRHKNFSFANKKVAILGSGGASKMVKIYMEKEGAKSIYIISRQGEYNYDNTEKWCDVDAIINATPVGMYPHTEDSPLQLEDFTQVEIVMDLIYNPLKTRLLLQAEERKIAAENGLYMLVAQAHEAAEYFLEKEITKTRIEEICEQIERSVENIVLIGMPGVGKTTMGEYIARRLGRECMDIDRLIEERMAMPIPEIFSVYGEEKFRDMETDIIREYSGKQGLVIATGGGAIMRKVNREYLMQNGKIYYIKRPLSALAQDNRPLSKGLDEIERLYEERKHIYETFSQKTISLGSTIEESQNIIEEEIIGRYKDENSGH